jgi:scyllo-inositol 2-dehydrogenase (NADP+)
MQVAAVMTRDPERQRQAAEELHCRIYGDLESFLADPGTDLGVLATPHDTHAPLAIAAMDAGKHVVTDKVMCLSVAEADAMIAARERNHVVLSVFHNRRWDWDYLTVQHCRAAKLLGRLLSVEQAVTNYRPPRGWRAEQRRSGGILFDWGAHLVDQLLLLNDTPVASVWCGITASTWDIDIGSYAKLVVRFADGMLGEVNTGNAVRLSKPRWYIVGSAGTLVKEGLDPQERAMLQGNIDQAQEDPNQRARIVTDIGGLTTTLVVESVHGSWRRYYENIAEAIERGAPLAVTAESARRNVAVLEAAMRSVTTGESIAVAI